MSHSRNTDPQYKDKYQDKKKNNHGFRGGAVKKLGKFREVLASDEMEDELEAARRRELEEF